MTALRHPNVVLFMAACTKPPKMCIVMEFMALGSLYDVRPSPSRPTPPALPHATSVVCVVSCRVVLCVMCDGVCRIMSVTLTKWRMSRSSPDLTSRITLLHTILTNPVMMSVRTKSHNVRNVTLQWQGRYLATPETAARSQPAAAPPFPGARR